MWVVVLNDGETYSSLQGCKILFVPSTEQGDNMDRYVEENEDKGIALNLTSGKYHVFSGDIVLHELDEIEANAAVGSDAEEVEE